MGFPVCPVPVIGWGIPMMNRFFLTAVLLAVPLRLSAGPVDLVVYGGTPAGISAAVVAAREGLSVTVVEPTKWIGGMVAGGLSKTDVGREETVGGFAREFFTRSAAAKPDTPMWFAEPHVNLETFAAMLKEAGVRVVTEQALREVAKEGTRIVSLTTADGTAHEGRVFVDASYEGGLMAAAKVAYLVGRESREQYGEPLAGHHPMPIRPRSVR